jgi:hypothetical protein
MKNFFRYTLLSFSALLILSACTDRLSELGSNDPDLSDSGKGVSCSLLKDSAIRESCESEIASVVAKFIQLEASNNFDVSLCHQLPAEFDQACTTEIELTGVQGPLREGDEVLLAEAFGLVSVDYGVAEGEEVPEDARPKFTFNKEKCSVLTTPGLTEYCEEQILEWTEADLFEDIIDAGILADCEKLQSEKFKGECFEYLDVSEEEIEVIEE